MKKIFLCVLLLASVLSSCMKHDNLYNGEGDDDSKKKKEEYDKNFPVKDIDPAQDWNMAKQVAVNVTVNYGGKDEYTIKIYSDNPRDPEVQAYLLGEIEHMKDGSTKALPVDAVSSSQSVYVCCVDAANGSVMKKGKVENGKVDVGFGSIPKNRAVSGRGDDEWLELKIESIASLVHPETGDFREGHTPSGRAIMTSYEFKYTGPFTIYPVFGETDGNDEIGYYYTSDRGIETKSLMENIQHNGERFIKVFWQGGWIEWVFYNRGYNAEMLQNSYATKMRSNPCIIEGLPYGCKVGFYVRPNGDQSYIYYSNKNLNNGREHSAVMQDDHGHPQYVGLEDNPKAPRDCNDIIFYIPGEPHNNTLPEVVDPDNSKPDTPATWIIACEDLGSTGDYDFNDIVFGVSHVAGQETAEVIPYAAGGTLPANIYWNNENLGEIHALLGNASTTTMINTNSKGNPGKPIEIEVDSKFSISSDMGGFSLKIGDKKVEIKAPGRGETPQMICVPGDWAWPTERTNISIAYPDFGEWGVNYNTGKEWWKNAKGSVVK